MRFKRSTKFDKHIPPSEVFVGHLTAEGDIRIDGTVRGQVRTPGKVVVGPDARVEGDVLASEVVVAGELTGRVEAARRLRVLDGARFYADAVPGTILIEEGAEFRGTVRLRSRRPDGRVEEVTCFLPAREKSHVPSTTTADPTDAPVLRQ